MGYGDEIMVSSIAKRIHAMTGERVTILGSNSAPRWSELWGGLPYMDRGRNSCLGYFNHPARRHYYSGMEGNRILWRKWDIAPGEIRLTDEEREWAEKTCPTRPFLIIEPGFKKQGGGGINKDWGWRRWADVSCNRTGMRDVNWLQFRHSGAERLPWIPDHDYKETPTFRHACAILERSIGYVGHEGGLHHAAAALGKPAVVVFGGYISPSVTGYARHTNLYTPDDRYPLGCGTVTPCEHCREAMNKITVEQVVSAVKEMVS